MRPITWLTLPRVDAKVVPMGLKIFLFNFNFDLLIYHMLCVLYTFRVCEKCFCFLSTWCHLQLWNFIPIWYKSGWAGSCLWEQGTALTFLTRLFFFFYKSASGQLFKTETVFFVKVSLVSLFFFLVILIKATVKGKQVKCTYTGTAKYIVRCVACNFF